MTKYTVHVKKSGDYYTTRVFVNGINCGVLMLTKNELDEFKRDLGAEDTTGVTEEGTK